MQHFNSLNLSKPLLHAIAEEGYTTPTPIQAKAIPPALEGRDLLGCAQTGTGKTAAFALPILHHLHSQPVDKSRRGPVKPRALILSPTRELTVQIADSFAAYGRHTSLSVVTIYGGVSQNNQVRMLRGGVDIIVATPGRLMDLMQQGYVDLSSIRIFVLDEADRMLDMGFIDPIRRISSALPAERQTLFFSATMPTNIARLADSLLKSPVKVAVTPVASTAERITQSLYMVDHADKPALLEQLLGDLEVERALVFTRTKHGADKLTKVLTRAGVRAEAIHGNKSQNQRQRALDAFRSGRTRVLVATDVAARGIDVDGVSHVFNFNLPSEPEAYVHRIGRTGRAGAAGVAISFCDREERGHLKAIERLTGLRLPVQPTRIEPRAERPTVAPPADCAPQEHLHAGSPQPHARAEHTNALTRRRRPRNNRKAHATPSSSPANRSGASGRSGRRKDRSNAEGAAATPRRRPHRYRAD
ncbi:MAG: DEAD/DEAH box helicase [Leptolyngbya sp. PLA3]|nr:MAG: DEAD/DEAH box helicase [Cyanobacteria bacterium CYA]MCE7967882.1 DEAD/DEAH box helicase [Leptolyngbya sp. PL-A3]